MRIINRISYGLSAIVLLVILYLTVIAPAQWRWETRREVIAILDSSKTTDELRKAVGPLGIFIPIRGGSWMAICYRDTHSLPFTSLAVARDSDGRMFQSTQHYCGQFSLYENDRKARENIRAEDEKSGGTETPPSPSPRPEKFLILDAVSEASSLNVARQQLLKLGFSPLSP